MFKKIAIENFRGIKDVELIDLRQFNLLVGKNNCGKTSLLESILLLSSPANPFNTVLTNNLRGYFIRQPYSWTVIFNKMDVYSTIRLTGELSKPETTRAMTIKVLPGRNIAQLSHESLDLSQRGSQEEFIDRIVGLSIEFSISKKPGEKQTYESKIWFGKDNKLESEPPKDYTEKIKSTFYSPAAVRSLVSERFNQIQIKKQEEKILNILRTVEPRLVKLSLGAENVLYCDMGFSKLLPFSTAGQGLNNLLSIILAIYETSDGIVLIDEIENGLHYSTQSILWDAILEAATAFNVQVFASTHSYETVKSLSTAYEKLKKSKKNKEDELRLFRIENENEKIRLVDFNDEILKTSIENFWEVR